jgi:hypothetical protein
VLVIQLTNFVAIARLPARSPAVAHVPSQRDSRVTEPGRVCRSDVAEMLQRFGPTAQVERLPAIL